MSNIFRITDPIPSDNSIGRYKDIEYEPVAGTNLNNSGGDIRLYMDFYASSQKLFFIIEGCLTKADNNSYGNADIVSLTNNALMHLFKSIRYELSGQEIEKIMYPGQATTMLGLLKYPDYFSKSKGFNQLWYKDTTTDAEEANTGWNVRKMYIINNSNPKGSFSVKVPLKHIFGFCEDYNKVV